MARTPVANGQPIITRKEAFTRSRSGTGEASRYFSAIREVYFDYLIRSGQYGKLAVQAGFIFVTAVVQAINTARRSA